MKTFLVVLVLGINIASAFSQSPDIKKYNVKWTTPSENSWGTMPAGNGDVGTNVWVTPDGVLHFFISKTDAFSENGRLLKIGKVSISFSPNILKGKNFTQELDILSGIIKIETGKAKLLFRVDANNPLIVLEGESNIPVAMEVNYEGWRNQRRRLKPKEMHSARALWSSKNNANEVKDIFVEPDEILSFYNGILWCHNNKRSIYPMVMEKQDMGDFIGKQPDPLLGRTFGALVYGEGLKNDSETKLVSSHPSKKISLNVIVKTLLNTTVENWITDIKSIKEKINSVDAKKMKSSHMLWWNCFWNKHYLIVTSKKERKNADAVTRGYLLQRYLNASAGRGGLPIKFNGTIFNVDIPNDYRLSGKNMKGTDADYRQWGGCYWFQNTRLPYWGMLFSGDFEMIKPFFKMYMDALPLARFRTQKYYGHRGVMFPETMYFWGAYAVTDYGWERDSTLNAGEIVNPYIRYYWQSIIELVAMMQDYYFFTDDDDFLNGDLTEFAKEVLMFYNEHYSRSSSGNIIFNPAQALETYWYDVVNPLPEVAGLRFVTSRFLKIKEAIKDKELSQLCEYVYSSLTDVPLRKDKKGKLLLSPAERYNDKTSNFENPELYAIFPYTLYGLGKQNNEIAKRSYKARLYKTSSGWQQDAIQAAYVGETAKVKNIIVKNFKAKNKQSRFPAFYGPNYDWIPDQDHGSVASRALQNMLIQQVGDSILLMPAWPKNWNCRFKIHANKNAVIEGEIEKGNIKKLKVEPFERRKDVFIGKKMQPIYQLKN